MERTVIILQSLLVLLATAHVATGCSCSQVDFNSVFCDYSTTEIRASVISAETRGGLHMSEENVPSRIYDLKLRGTFKKGPMEISTRVSIFHIVSIGEISQCGVSLEPGNDYILVGNVNNEGKFITNACKIIRQEDVSKSDMDLLKSKRADLDCADNI